MRSAISAMIRASVIPNKTIPAATTRSPVRFMLDSEEIIRSFMPDWSRQNGNQVSLALECASPSEVDEIYARVTAAGFEGEKEPWDAYWGQRYALLGDPDGVRVNLYAPLETS